MNVVTWYVHCIKYNVEQCKYIAETFGPYSTLDHALDVKRGKEDLQKFTMVEINQKSKMEFPNLV